MIDDTGYLLKLYLAFYFNSACSVQSIGSLLDLNFDFYITFKLVINLRHRYSHSHNFVAFRNCSKIKKKCHLRRRKVFVIFETFLKIFLFVNWLCYADISKVSLLAKSTFQIQEIIQKRPCIKEIKNNQWHYLTIAINFLGFFFIKCFLLV